MSLHDRPTSAEPAQRAPSRHSVKSSTSSQPQLNDVPEDDIAQNGAPLQYHHQPYIETPAKKVQRASQMTIQSISSSSSGENSNPHLRLPRTGPVRPHSTASMTGDPRGRVQEYGDNLSPRGSPRGARAVSTGRFSPDNRPMSYIDLLNEVPYHQQVAPVPTLDNSRLQMAVGSNASLLDTKKTLDMYRANVKKTNDPAIQYEFAIFMVNAARDAIATGQSSGPGEHSAQDMIKDAKELLQKLSDRGYPFAQYYLADGYASGFFNKDKIDYDKAFPLFIAASKHGHAEASYRAALCYEFGWGTAKSYPKAAQYHRNAASKGHPGAAVRLGLACLKGDMGLGVRYREGVKWLKRAQEGADAQYNSGPFELGLLHVEGCGDDIFKDEAYAAQLFTQSAELGHAESNYRMGQAYELGLLGCPKDAALSVHFYNGAATAGVAPAMLALCAWYMVGAEPVLEKDECEAYEWAKRAAELGFDKAEYALAYFTEMGIGCRRDPLEANMWYVRAAEKGNETAKQRLAIIRAAASGESGVPMEKGTAKTKELANGKDKDCIVM
ncbi:HCP-like protein [Myriangium duriaei CBS 260.36]|uniref:HCP-like protein n=1 Tax=Myriangium duriaei CBS 260.36 TaxID=1168546 RepID=A0A9P4J962_9PEZI|nr:HCP-like protein [Myriangium duriaei CBS 260.36]